MQHASGCREIVSFKTALLANFGKPQRMERANKRTARGAAGFTTRYGAAKHDGGFKRCVFDF